MLTLLRILDIIVISYLEIAVLTTCFQPDSSICTEALLLYDFIFFRSRVLLVPRRSGNDLQYIRMARVNLSHVPTFYRAMFYGPSSFGSAPSTSQAPPHEPAIGREMLP